MSYPPAQAASSPAATAFFRVLWDPKTYLGCGYLVLEFALATFYFVFLVTVLSVGISLVWTFLGIPVLFFALVMARTFSDFEARLAEQLGGLRMPRVSSVPEPGRGFWARMFSLLTDGDSWLCMLNLLVRFPLATIAFSVAVSLIGGGLWGMTMWIPVALGYHEDWGVWQLDTVPEALIFVIPGAVLFFLSLYVVRGLVWLLGQTTRVLVGRMSHYRRRDAVLGALAGERVLDGPSLLRELEFYHGYSVDLTPASVYATLVDLGQAGMVEATTADGVQWFRLTGQGEEAAVKAV